MTIEETINTIHNMGRESEDLDDLVHSVASKIASDINNEGLTGQLEFLKSNGWDDATVIKYLIEE